VRRSYSLEGVVFAVEDVLSLPDELLDVSLLELVEEDDESPEPLLEELSLFDSCPAPFGPRFFEP
jgi:hypothetical protein